VFQLHGVQSLNVLLAATSDSSCNIRMLLFASFSAVHSFAKVNTEYSYPGAVFSQEYLGGSAR
jgi:Ni/Fe-hydrogenase subunit HybB-like protein